VIAIVGGGPAGLMAAEAAALSGASVHVFERMPSVGRKFLMAGKSGLNLTHAEPFDDFMSRFGAARPLLEPSLAAFGPTALRAWADGLGIRTFVGSSGRVFPVDFKAAPLLRAWVRRLREAGVTFRVRHRWVGFGAAGGLDFATPAGRTIFAADAAVLAMGGASWPQLGSDGAWASLLRQQGIGVMPLRPANCGFDIAWSDHFRARFAGHPVKPVVLSTEAGAQRGEFVVTATGIEGSLVYGQAAFLRDRIAAEGSADIVLDLAPDREPARLLGDLRQPRGARSLAEHLRRTCGISGVKAGLLRESLPPAALADPDRLARGIKALPLRVGAARPIAEAISSAGGVAFAGLDDTLMLRAWPGLFCAGEMLDWEVGTGGYLLTACFALGRRAGSQAARWPMRAGPGTCVNPVECPGAILR
jgi:uncharacterized flavoprotein (TIGR03862 family)